MNDMSGLLSRAAFSFFYMVLIYGCASGGGIQVVDLNPQQAGPLRCLGVESHDIFNISQNAVRDIEINFLKKNPQLMREGRPIRVIVDSEQFTNESAQDINLNMITDQLAVDLKKASGAKMAFLSREDVAVVQKERALKRQGMVDKGALGLVDKIAGADYRLAGRISSQSIQSDGGQQQRATKIALWLVDLETSARIWSWTADLHKGGRDDIYCQ